ncbi:hypothetical protein HWV62_28332 [Athelia sp. TMB]|nr:hypothetical protein HWV62_28332 [Athelia sp. TMB]
MHHSVRIPRLRHGIHLDTVELELKPGGTLWPTHVLALSQPNSDDLTVDAEGDAECPLLIPIDEVTWREKTSTPLPPSRPRRGSSGRVIVVPIVPLEVPHPDSIPLLLLFAMGLEPVLELARQLLPPDVMGEFPDADAMVIRMGQDHDAEQIQQYVVRNRQLRFNSLRLGILDRPIINMIELSHKVAVRAQDRRRLHNSGSRTPPLPAIRVDSGE